VIRLQIQPLPGEAFEHLLETESLVIGRSSTCDVTVSGRFTSRRHARLFRRGGQLLVEDLGSRNGTLLNGELVLEPTPIGPGDVLEISDFIISIDEIAPPVPLPSSGVANDSSSLAT
jgi:pSer/pThr/pTyr-binding forkhead associated (FHA) protein